MKSFDEYCKSLVLSKYKLPIQEARTFEEFLDLNNLTETTVSDEANVQRCKLGMMLQDNTPTQTWQVTQFETMLVY